MNLIKNLKEHLLYLYNKRRLKGIVKFTSKTHISHDSEFEGMNAVGKLCSFKGKMGLGSYIGNYNYFSANIGRFSSLGSNIRQIIESHPYKEPFVSTSPMFYSLKQQNGQTFADKQYFTEYRYLDAQSEIAFEIGNDCWIGNSVTIIGGVKIGDGAVILSHAVVTKDIPPYAIAGGVPAKIIHYRYDSETINFLQEIKWWNNSPEWFTKNWRLLIDIDKLKEYYISKNNI